MPDHHPDLYVALRRPWLSLMQRAVAAELVLIARRKGPIFRVPMSDVAANLGENTAESTIRTALKALKPLVVILDQRKGAGPRVNVGELLRVVALEPTPETALRHLWDGKHPRRSRTDPDGSLAEAAA